MELREALLERALAQLECALAHYRLTYALHDIAHVFALPHAPRQQSQMHGSRTNAQIDDTSV